MGLMKTSWVCWSCRTTARRQPHGRDKEALCQHCGGDMTELYWKWTVPRRGDDRGWAKLHKRWQKTRRRADRWLTLRRGQPSPENARLWKDD